MKNKKKLFLFLAISALIVLGLQAWDDQDIFTEIKGGKGKSNVVLIQDHTGSMCSIIYHPDFNPKISLSAYSQVDLPNATALFEGITRTSWYIRWFIAPTTINAYTTYAIGHTFTSTGTNTGTLLVGSEGVNLKVGDWILQYDPNDTDNINHQAIGRVTAISAPDTNKFFTLTLADIKGTFVHDYRLYVWASTATLKSYSSSVLQVNGDLRSYFALNQYILLYDKDDVYNTGRQVVARVAATPTYSSSTGRTSLTLADIIGTISVTGTQDTVYYRKPAETRLVKLYGSTLDQGDYDVAYGVGPSTVTDYTYLKWIFGVANDTQRQQVTDFSTLAYNIEYNAYLMPTTDTRYPVSPTNAKMLNEDYPLNSNSTVSLLEEWNTVMKAIYPNKIANLRTAITTTGLITINYEKHKASLVGYSAPFKIKIDAETMWVTGKTLDADGKGGTLTIGASGRGYNNTVAAAHPAGAAIMIYNDANIDEYTPEIHLFSSMQHVTEATGEVNQAWFESKNINGTNKNCYRYKRVFTRIQVAREALCDVITAKNLLLKVADLAADYSDVATDLIYEEATAAKAFKTRIAPFYIKVSAPSDPDSDEIMKVTAHNQTTYTLTVTRAQQGTSACTHTKNSVIMAYSGVRDLVRFGIFSFNSNDNPAQLMVGLNDFGQKNTDGTYKTASYINTSILNSVNGLTGSGSTPLAGALAKVWNYMKPNVNNGAPGANYISSDWKAVDATTFVGIPEKFELIDGVTHPKGSPMEYWCQENYAVMITDGDAVSDSLPGGVLNATYSLKNTIAGNVINNFYLFDYNYSSPTPWGDTVTDPSGEYLTDVAYFLFHQDMFPTKKIVRLANDGNWDTTSKIFTTDNPVADTALYDESNSTATIPNRYYMQWPGNQNIKTYTIGLCLTNTVLPKAAKNGGGASFTASNYRDLSEAFLNIITSVELSQEATSYTTYAAPKQSITGGKYGYIAHFKPQNGKAMWDGHLRRYRLSDTGAFPDDIDSLTEKVSVTEGSTTTEVVSFQWDAGVILNTRTVPRVVYTSIPSAGIWNRLDFMGSGITYTDLDVTNAQVNTVKYFMQNFNKADNINANSDYNNLYRLGETFHFNPQLVGYPLAWKADLDPSYQSFYNHYADDDDPATPANPTARAEVVYAGANDGKLHCFQASNGSELWSYIPFTQLKNLKNAVPSILTEFGKHTYFVDGKSIVMDIKASTTFTGDETWKNWKTGLFFGMGMGGRSYCALDVTNPADLKILWEFDDGYNASTNPNGCMGFTEAKPVVVDMNAGSTLGNFPGAILAGGYNEKEVQATDTTDPAITDWQRREGKALYILNANTGAVVKKFVYGTAASNTATLNTIPGFLTAMTAAPAVFDKNNDGIADVIYLAESGDYKLGDFPTPHGGAIWKITCYGDPANWTAQKIYQAPDGQTIFISPSLAYDADYRVWVMFGTGRRPKPVERSNGVFTNLTGQFVAFIDDNSGTAITNADLHNAATSGNTDYTIDDNGTVKKGFFFNFHLANEIMYEPQPLYINKTVYFMTFVPREGTGSSDETGDDPCGGDSAVKGSHYIYQFKLSAQGNTFTIGDFMIQGGKILGYGPMDDTFTIYVGPGDAGTFESIEANRINEELENNNNAMLWKEDKK